jgi:hypothetical protein
MPAALPAITKLVLIRSFSLRFVLRTIESLTNKKSRASKSLAEQSETII